jgi:hypothetical protein
MMIYGRGTRGTLHQKNNGYLHLILDQGILLDWSTKIYWGIDLKASVVFTFSLFFL